LTLWRIFILGRSVVTGTFLLLLVLMNGLAPKATLRPLYLLSLVQFATNGFYLYLWRRRDIRSLDFFSFSLEIVLISLLIFLLGADGFVFALAYLWPIIMGGWLIGRRAVPPLTLLAITGYGALVFLAQRDWLTPPLLLPTGIPQTLVLCLPYLAFVSLLVWLLTREMERGERHLQVRNRDLHRLNFGLRYLVSAGEELLGCLDVGEMVALGLRKVAKLTGYPRGAVYLREGATLSRRANHELSPAADAAGMPAGIPAEWLDPEGVEHCKPIHTVSLATDVAHPGGTSPTSGSLTHVALRSGRGLEGVLTIASSEAKPFDSAEEQILQVLGHQLGVALENVRLLANLQHERNLLGSILAHMADGVLVVDPDGSVLLANAAAHALLDVSEGEVLPEWLGSQMGGGTDGHADGRHVVELQDHVIGLSVAELGAGPGLPRATIYVARDITQEAQLERAKSDFVAYVSHELRTPLTTIKMLVRLLLMDVPQGSKQQEYLSVINTQVTRQTRLVSNLLDLTRLEAGKYDLPLEDVDPRAVVQSAVRVCRPLAEEKGLHLIVECPAQASAIAANAGGLEQVLVNLLSNAIKFTDPGGRVTARCDPQIDALHITVEDTGIGMSVEQAARIFDKFYTVRNPHRRGEGTGLGLAISKMIVHELGGTIEVASREGQGSRFTVRLPWGATAAPPSEAGPSLDQSQLREGPIAISGISRP